jgi:plastocyanin
MYRLVIPILLLGTSAVASAQPELVTVQLSNFKFVPSTIQLRAGTPTILRLQNASRGGHNFSAPDFFAAARVEGKSAAVVRKGTVEVPRRGTVDISLVPVAGSYRVKCTHTLHSTFGMKGTILVR